MRRTLLLIPHEIASIPVFGLGWLLGLLLLAAVVTSIVIIRRGGKLGEYWSEHGLLWGLVAAVIALLLPGVELTNPAGDPVGLAIRGYGVMMLGGIISAVTLATLRARRYGLGEEAIWGLAPWVVVGGLVGARMFFVIQYQDQFFVGGVLETLRRIASFTEGGLVVYGSFIGGFLATVLYSRRSRVPLLTLGDVVIPSLFLGVALGRIGCLLNGCCYGATCDDFWAALRFPPGSPVYEDQLRSGHLVGITLTDSGGAVAELRRGSLAEAAGVRAGDAVDQLRPVAVPQADDATRPQERVRLGLEAVIGGQPLYWAPDELPVRAEPVLPTQLISSVGALAICLVLCAVSGYVHRPGAIMLSGFILYAIMRFGIEVLRSDEPGRFGTQLTISQWVSIIVLVLSAVAMLGLPSASLRDASQEPVAKGA